MNIERRVPPYLRDGRKRMGDKLGKRYCDRIVIKDLLVRGIVGINEEERSKRQDILLNLELVTDVKAVGDTDDIEQACNYRTVSKSVIKLVEESVFFTVEKLATEIARLTLADPEIREVEVSVEKPGALRFARSVGVAIRRRSEDFKS
jgi:FolB domain-containing protein